MYLLDTDTCIFLLNGVNSPAEKYLRDLGRNEVGLATITLAELYYGAAHSKQRENNERRVKIFAEAIALLPFDQEAAQTFGAIKELLVSKGELIGTMDLLIASIAVAHKATLVTHNTKDFNRIKELSLQDWFKAT